MAAGGSINHPKSALARSKRKNGKVSKQKKVSKKMVNVDPLTTSHIIKKTRTNPNANITLSGKKRRLLLKQLKREEQEKKKMDVEIIKKPKTETKTATKAKNSMEKMDTT